MYAFSAFEIVSSASYGILMKAACYDDSSFFSITS